MCFHEGRIFLRKEKKDLEAMKIFMNEENEMNVLRFPGRGEKWIQRFACIYIGKTKKMNNEENQEGKIYNST